MDRKLTIMPCLDMINGRVVKGVNFVNIKDAGDPVECCRAYCAAGADELAMLDITATVEGRKTLLEVVRKVADAVIVPFTMGGGISSAAAAEEVLKAGANKISTSSAVFRRPEMIGEMVRAFGPERVTVAIDVAQNAAMPSGYEVFIDGGRTATGKDAIEWTKQVNDFGVACILPTSKSTDGVRTGYDLPLIRKIRAITDASVVASGGVSPFCSAASTVSVGCSRRNAYRVPLPRHRHPGAEEVPRRPRPAGHLVGTALTGTAVRRRSRPRRRARVKPRG